MRKCRFAKAITMLLSLLLITSCYCNMTIAKFTDTGTGTIRGTVLPMTTPIALGSGKTVSVDLFTMGKVYDTAGLPAIVQETDVELQDDGGANQGNAQGNALIAPGTWGYVDIAFDVNTSIQTMCTVSIDATLANTSSSVTVTEEHRALLTERIKFFVKYVDPAVTDSGLDTGTDLALFEPLATGSFQMPITETYHTIRVYWMWDYGDPLEDRLWSWSGYLWYITASANITLEQIS